MLRPKKIHTRNLITKKIPAAGKFSNPSPNNFSNGPSLNCLYSELSSVNDAPALRDSYIYTGTISLC